MGLHEQRAIMLRGDPGLWGALKGAVKGFIKGGPLGAVVGGVKGGFAPGRVAPPPPQLPPPGSSGIPRPSGGFFPLVSIPGVAPALRGALPPAVQGFAGQVGVNGAPQGYHLNKSGYYTSMGYVAPRSKWVRNRTRNISNGKANMRALRRLTAWDKADRKRRTTLKRIAR